jgi:hypothetical protein
MEGKKNETSQREVLLCRRVVQARAARRTEDDQKSAAVENAVYMLLLLRLSTYEAAQGILRAWFSRELQLKPS